MSLSFFKDNHAASLHQTPDSRLGTVPGPDVKRHRFARPHAADRVVHRCGGPVHVSL